MRPLTLLLILIVVAEATNSTGNPECESECLKSMGTCLNCCAWPFLPNCSSPSPATASVDVPLSCTRPTTCRDNSNITVYNPYTGWRICAHAHESTNCSGERYILSANYSTGRQTEEWEDLGLLYGNWTNRIESLAVMPGCTVTLCTLTNLVGDCKLYASGWEPGYYDILPSSHHRNTGSLRCRCDWKPPNQSLHHPPPYHPPHPTPRHPNSTPSR